MRQVVVAATIAVAVWSVLEPPTSYYSVRSREVSSRPQAIATRGCDVGREIMRYARAKITFGEMISNGGPTGILVYCADYRCNQSIEIPADRWPDGVRLSDIEPRLVCRACGKHSADVSPHFQPAQMSNA